MVGTNFIMNVTFVKQDQLGYLFGHLLDNMTNSREREISSLLRFYCTVPISNWDVSSLKPRPQDHL